MSCSITLPGMADWILFLAFFWRLEWDCCFLLLFCFYSSQAPLHNLSKMMKSGLAIISASSHSTHGYIPSVTMDLCTSSLPKWPLIQSSSTKVKWAHIFSSIPFTTVLREITLNTQFTVTRLDSPLTYLWIWMVFKRFKVRFKFSVDISDVEVWQKFQWMHLKLALLS